MGVLGGFPKCPPSAPKTHRSSGVSSTSNNWGGSKKEVKQVPPIKHGPPKDTETLTTNWGPP